MSSTRRRFRHAPKKLRWSHPGDWDLWRDNGGRIRRKFMACRAAGIRGPAHRPPQETS